MAGRVIASWPLAGGLLDSLAQALGGLGDVPVAVRSSANSEDTVHASGAGQHESVLAVRGVPDVAAAVRTCWESLHSSRAIAYRNDPSTNHPPPDEPAMAVLIQRLVDADISGVMFTPADPESPTEIEASWGLGPAVVGGTVTPDAYRVAPDGTITRTIAHKQTRLDRTGTQPSTNLTATHTAHSTAKLASNGNAHSAAALVSSEDTRSGTGQVGTGDTRSHASTAAVDASSAPGLVSGGLVVSEVSGVDRDRATLDDATVARLVLLGQRVAAVLGGPQDIEWAIADSHIWILQARPITATPPPAPSEAPVASPTVLTGTPASHGLVAGTARIVRGPADFLRVRPGDILVCPYTDPAWTPLLRIAAGVLTETGGVLSHAAIVARELRIPAILGIPDATTRIHDGATITINGTTGTVTTTVPDAAVTTTISDAATTTVPDAATTVVSDAAVTTVVSEAP
ncbi:PEP/pyruvate-binding domain-containing protein [Kribbella sp. CA-294648]|uniref:PEP/pyruvate-binding domain-containing protein n=1 Tax=Kribbella sp. CA-294648 TaxID=3239948 RepID=UPI003D908477